MVSIVGWGAIWIGIQLRQARRPPRQATILSPSRLAKIIALPCEMMVQSSAGVKTMMARQLRLQEMTL